MKEKSKYPQSFDSEKIKTETAGRIKRLGLISVLIVILTFGIFLTIFPLSTRLLEVIGYGDSARQLDWNILAGIASLLTMCLVIGGLVFAYFENIQNSIQRKQESAATAFNIYKDVSDRLMRSESLAARRWLILNLKTVEEFGNDNQKWMKHVRRKLNEVPEGRKGERPPGLEYLKIFLNDLDFIGFVAEHYWSMENELILWVNPPIAKVWERIEVYVEDEADRRNEEDYYESARRFGKYCVDWRRKNHPKSNIIDNGT